MSLNILLGVVMFTTTVLALVGIILAARARLVSSGDVNILINDDPDKTISVSAGGKLLNTLADKGFSSLARVEVKERAHNVGVEW